MSTDKKPAIDHLSAQLGEFSDTLNDNEQTMLSAIFGLAEDQRLRLRSRLVGVRLEDADDGDVQGFGAGGMSVSPSRGAVFESTQGFGNSSSRPIIVCGSGTAQVNRVWSLMERMGESGCLDRVQSAILYDINMDTRRRIANKSRDMRSSQGTRVFQPQYIPSDDGFHRNPHGYLQYAGRLLQEQESLVGDVSSRSDRIGTAPQLIVHFIGFGSHSILGAKLHNKLTEEFPDCKSLVVLGIPRDPTLHDQMRAIWDEFVGLLPDQGFLITDDRIGDPASQDHKLACAIASIEASSQSGSGSGPTLPDVISSLSQDTNGKWMGVSSIKSFEIPMLTSWSMLPPFRKTRLVRGKGDEINMLPIKAIKAAMSDRWQIADHKSPDSGTRSMVVCTMPLKNDELPRLHAQVQELLRYDGFFEKNPRTTVALASAQFASNSMIRQTPNLPKRRNILFSMAIGFMAGLWTVGDLAFGWVFGKKPAPLYLHCSRIYTVPGAEDPTREIGTLSSILMVESGESQGQNQDRLGNDTKENWADAVDSILREPDPA